MTSEKNDDGSGPSFATALVAGGLAGTSVDVALFPIDTLKTRLQSPQGFLNAGGFRGIYNGLGAAAAGSAPGAALFFSTYEVRKISFPFPTFLFPMSAEKRFIFFHGILFDDLYKTLSLLINFVFCFCCRSI